MEEIQVESLIQSIRLWKRHRSNVIKLRNGIFEGNTKNVLPFFCRKFEFFCRKFEFFC